MTRSPETRTCAAPDCDVDLTGTHGKRKWCSERCRKDTLYAGVCIDCGGVTDGVKSRASRPASRCRSCQEGRYGERNERMVEMWEAGEPTWHIAEVLGMQEKAVTAWIAHRRLSYGEDLPLRRIGGDAAERDRRHREMIELRRQGLGNAEIAERVGMASTASVHVAFSRMKREGWEVPPNPTVLGVPRVSDEDILAALESGDTYEEIARVLGYKGPSAITGRVRRMRARGVEIPERKPGPHPKFPEQVGEAERRV